MALITEEEARIRSDGGTRGPVVLEPGEVLSPSARAYLTEHRIQVTRAKTSSGYRTEAGERLREKPEHMTHLNGHVLVDKTHPRIKFRGMIDQLEGEILLAQLAAHRGGCEELAGELGEVLRFVRQCIRYDVLEEPVGEVTLCGLTADELREHSHHPEKYYGQSHFLPSWEDGEVMLWLNRVRTTVRQTELAACQAWPPGSPNSRQDIIQGLNRLSSLLWIQMIRLKAGKYGGTAWKQ